MGKGALAVLGGIQFVVTTPSMWGHALLPLAMLLLLLCGLCGVGGWGARELSLLLFGDQPGNWGQAGGWLATVLLAATFWLAGVLLALVLAQPLSGFALDAISLAQERTLTGHQRRAPSLGASLLMSTKIALITLVVGGIILTVLLVIDLAFPPAALVTVPLKFLVGAWLLAWNFIDYPLGLRRLGLRSRLRWASRHFAPFITFGLVWAILLLVPGVFFLVLPMGVAGATWLVVHVEQTETGGQESGVRSQGS